MHRSPSIKFKESLSEVGQLLAIHEQLTGTGPGRRHKVEVLNKSAILFACAAFEAFVESLATDAFSHVVDASPDHSALPKAVLRSIAETVKADRNELKVWELAGTGWRAVCDSYKKAVLSKYVGPFNTPKPHNVESLLRELVGLPDLPQCWKWNGMTAVKAEAKLKQFVALRGSLAHGEKPAPKVTKRDVTTYVSFLAPLSVRSSNHVREHCYKVTGKHPWPRVSYGTIE
jgi:hypothetical protein